MDRTRSRRDVGRRHLDWDGVAWQQVPRERRRPRQALPVNAMAFDAERDGRIDVADKAMVKSLCTFGHCARDGAGRDEVDED